MDNAVGFTRRTASFARRWGLPIVIGAVGGFAHVILAIEPLVGRLGPVGGALASLSGIGLGLLLAVFTFMFGQVSAGGSQNQPMQPATEV